MREFERKQLLERIERDGATVGADIPDTITVQGDDVDLREFVFEIKRRDTIPSGERERVEQAKQNLRRERVERRGRIEAGDVSYERGKELARSIVGIDRALNALDQLGEVDLEGEIAARETADRHRWMKFLTQALGHESDDAGRSSSNRGIGK